MRQLIKAVNSLTITVHRLHKTLEKHTTSPTPTINTTLTMNTTPTISTTSPTDTAHTAVKRRRYTTPPPKQWIKMYEKYSATRGLCRNGYTIDPSKDCMLAYRSRSGQSGMTAFVHDGTEVCYRVDSLPYAVVEANMNVANDGGYISMFHTRTMQGKVNNGYDAGVEVTPVNIGDLHYSFREWLDVRHNGMESPHCESALLNKSMAYKWARLATNPTRLNAALTPTDAHFVLVSEAGVAKLTSHEHGDVTVFVGVSDTHQYSAVVYRYGNRLHEPVVPFMLLQEPLGTTNADPIVNEYLQLVLPPPPAVDSGDEFIESEEDQA